MKGDLIRSNCVRGARVARGVAGVDGQTRREDAVGKDGRRLSFSNFLKE